MLYNAKQHRLSLSGSQVDYITFGKGTKTLVMIQGLNTGQFNGMAVPLAFMYRIFAKDYTVYIFDRKKDLREGITVRDLAEDIADAMDKLGIKNADIFGVSQGGMIAQYIALDRSDLVNKLVLAVTLSKNNYTLIKTINNWITLTEQGNMKELVKDMAGRMYSDKYLRKYRPFLPLLAILQKPKDTQRFITLAKSCLTCNTYDELEKIKCPVYVIGGRKDKVLTGEASEVMADKLGCEIFMYNEYGHAAYEEAKDFNKRVYDFLLRE
ncbi:MAG: alpha/beta hydrolase [Anaerofustis stercorihominis]|nr:alpha/beta hydrolase [Anaerofustis stercorihominis]